MLRIEPKIPNLRNLINIIYRACASHCEVTTSFFSNKLEISLPDGLRKIMNLIENNYTDNPDDILIEIGKIACLEIESRSFIFWLDKAEIKKLYSRLQALHTEVRYLGYTSIYVYNKLKLHYDSQPIQIDCEILAEKFGNTFDPNAFIKKAGENGYIKVVKWLHDNYEVDVNSILAMLKQYACTGHALITKFLLENVKVDPAICDGLLSIAAYNNHGDVMVVLWQHSTQSVQVYNEAMLIAAIKGCSKTISLCLSAIDKSIWLNVTMCAAEHGHMKAIDFAMKYSSKLDILIAKNIVQAVTANGHINILEDVLTLLERKIRNEKKFNDFIVDIFKEAAINGKVEVVNDVIKYLRDDSCIYYSRYFQFPTYRWSLSDEDRTEIFLSVLKNDHTEVAKILLSTWEKMQKYFGYSGIKKRIKNQFGDLVNYLLDPKTNLLSVQLKRHPALMTFRMGLFDSNSYIPPMKDVMNTITKMYLASPEQPKFNFKSK